LIFMARKIVLLLLAVALVAGCAEKKRTGGTAGGTLIVGVTDEPSTLNPLLLSLTATTGQEIARKLFLSLHRLNDKMEIVPDLAEHWVFAEDFSYVTYYLRRNVKWSDGTPVTSADVVFTFEKMRDPKVGYPNAHALDLVSKVDTLDKHTVRFYFKQVYADELLDSGIPVLPKHVLEKESDLAKAAFSTRPITDGPFRLALYLPGDRIELSANPEFYGGRPYFDKVVFKFYPDQASLLSDLQAGKVDFAPELPATEFATLQGDKSLTLVESPPASYTYIAWNLQSPIFSDPEVRKALTLAINREALVKDILAGKGQVVSGPIPSSSWAFNTEVKPLPYDPGKAKELLSKQGWAVKEIQKPRERTKDTLLVKGNRPLEFSLMTSKGNRVRQAIAEQVRKDLAPLRIRVNVDVVDAATFAQRVLDKKYDAMILSWSTGLKVDPSPVWHTPSEEGQKGRYNFVGYSNPRADTLMDEAMAKFDRRRAKTLWQKFQAMVAEDNPITFLYAPIKLSAVYAKVQGVKPSPVGLMASLDDWWAPKGDTRLVENRVTLAAVPAAPETANVDLEARLRAAAESTAAARRLRADSTRLAVVAPVDTSKPVEHPIELAKVDTTTKVVVPPPETTVVEIPPTKAELVQFVPPVYPESDRQAGRQGRVYVKVTVGPDGVVKDARVIKGIGGGCDDAAQAAAKKCKFKPGTKNGQPSDDVTTIPFTFQLE
jgi:peptide/nickel transport system substrate-binding protein